MIWLNLVSSSFLNIFCTFFSFGICFYHKGNEHWNGTDVHVVLPCCRWCGELSWTTALKSRSTRRAHAKESGDILKYPKVYIIFRIKVWNRTFYVSIGFCSCKVQLCARWFTDSSLWSWWGQPRALALDSSTLSLQNWRISKVPSIRTVSTVVLNA